MVVAGWEKRRAEDGFGGRRRGGKEGPRLLLPPMDVPRKRRGKGKELWKRGRRVRRLSLPAQVRV